MKENRIRSVSVVQMVWIISMYGRMSLVDRCSLELGEHQAYLQKLQRLYRDIPIYSINKDFSTGARDRQF